MISQEQFKHVVINVGPQNGSDIFVNLGWRPDFIIGFNYKANGLAFLAARHIPDNTKINLTSATEGATANGITLEETGFVVDASLYGENETMSFSCFRSNPVDMVTLDANTPTKQSVFGDGTQYKVTYGTDGHPVFPDTKAEFGVYLDS